MKTTTNFVAVLTILFSAVAMAVANADSINGSVSILELSPTPSGAVIQDEGKPPTPDEQVAPVESAIQEPVPAEAPIPADVPAVVQEPVVVAEPVAPAEPAVVAEPAAIAEPIAPVEPVVQEPVAPVPAEMVIEAPSVMADSGMMNSFVMEQSTMYAPVASGYYPTCCPTPCKCCPPTPTVFCLQDPCGCSHEACVKVPACCNGEQPCITWKKGILGRQIATLCWTCCGHEVKVIVCRRGKVKVRG